MKAMKKILAVLLTLTLVAALIPAAFADDEDPQTPTKYSITITNSDTGYTYVAYQIFAGENDNGNLSKIVWGANATTDVQSALRTLANVSDDANAADVAKALQDNSVSGAAIADAIGAVSDLGDAITTDEGTYTFSDLDCGYYFVKDINVPEGGSFTKYIVKVVADENVEIAAKNSVPSLVKKVDDINDSTGVAQNLQDSADYDIGDLVPFTITGTLASNVEKYGYYYVKFEDKMDAGLTFERVTKITVINGDNQNVIYTNSGVVDGEQTETWASEVTALAYEEQPVISGAGQNLTVTFPDAKKVGATNNSVIKVEYLAELNSACKIGSEGNKNAARMEFSNNPNVNMDGEKGTTPWDIVIVFTYTVEVNKTDKDGNELTGATFELIKILADGSEVSLGEITGAAQSKFTWPGIDDGKYKLVEKEAPDGYNMLTEPIEFTVTAGHVAVSETVSNDWTKMLTSLEGSEESDLIEGLTVFKTTGVVSTNVVNQSGAVLPSTGGIGTTLFYVFGSILVIGAGVLLVSKKRMGAAE